MKRTPLILIILALALVAASAFALPAATRILRLYVISDVNVGNTTSTNAITKTLAANIDYDFGAVDGGCLDSAAATVTGAKKGDPCFVGIGPGDGGNQMLTDNATFSCYVSAADAVKVRFCANLAGNGYIIDPVDAGYQVRVLSAW